MTWLFWVPLISALMGWLIHTITSHYVLYRYLPKQDEILAQKVGTLADTYIKESFNLEEKITDPRLIENAMPYIEKHIDDFLNVKLKEEIPMLAMFVGNKTTDTIKEVFMNQLRELFPQVMLQVTGNLQSGMNIGASIRKKLEEIPVSGLIKKEAKGQVGRFRLLGLLSGFIIGVINVLLIYFLYK